jgi:hypothetical protein
LDLKLFGNINEINKIGFINIENGTIYEKTYNESIKNVSGELSFNNEELSIENLKGNILDTPISIDGKIKEINNIAEVNLTLKMEEVEIDKLKSNFKRFGYKIADYFSVGRSNLSLKIIQKNNKSSISGAGDFNGCKIIIATELFELEQVTGKFEIIKNKVVLKEFFGVWGNIPFKGNGKIGSDIHNRFNFLLDFSKFTQSDFNFSIKTSLSRLNFSDESSGFINISSIDEKLFVNLCFVLKNVDINLYPLPININIDKINGELKFVSEESGIRFDTGKINYNSNINCKFRIPFLKLIPVTLRGKSRGNLTFNESDKLDFSFKGKINMSDGEIKFTDSEYSSKKIEVKNLRLDYSYSNDQLYFKSYLHILDGLIDLSGLIKYNLKDYFKINFKISDIDLNDFYKYNSKCYKIFRGIMNGTIFCESGIEKYVLKSKLRIKNGSLRNIFLIQDLFTSVLDNKIYNLPFEEINFAIWTDGEIVKIKDFILKSSSEELKKLEGNLKKEFNITIKGKIRSFQNNMKKLYKDIENINLFWKIPFVE